MGCLSGQAAVTARDGSRLPFSVRWQAPKRPVRLQGLSRSSLYVCQICPSVCASATLRFGRRSRAGAARGPPSNPMNLRLQGNTCRVRGGPALSPPDPQREPRRQRRLRRQDGRHEQDGEYLGPL